MEWDEWAEQLYDFCVVQIKKTDPFKNPLEWNMLWELLENWKNFREEKSKHDKEKENE